MGEGVNLLFNLPDFLVFLTALLVQKKLIVQMAGLEAESRWAVRAGGVASSVLLAGGLLLTVSSMAGFEPANWGVWWRGCAFAWAISVAGATAVSMMWKTPGVSSRHRFSPDRRRLLGAARYAVLAAPVALTGFGILVGRSQFRLEEVNLKFAGLAKDLDGIRIALISDIHLGAFFDVSDLDRVIGMANETKPHLAVVTGDLITSSRDPLAECLQRLSLLKSDAGTFACMGNHERYARMEHRTETEGERWGIRFLRQAARQLQFGAAALNLAGVDYQRMRTPYLAGAERLVQPGQFNVLLSHNPDVFPVAAAKGFDLTLAGHTHGGQVNFEILQKNVNFARFYTPFTSGLYRRGEHAVYVTRGVGTIGIPARIGAPPEVSLVRLCAT